MLSFRILIRRNVNEPLEDVSIRRALGQKGILVRKAEMTREGMAILCKGDIRTLRLCAEHLASFSFVSGVSMQRCDDSDA
jgi:hypothetical protein